MTTAGRLKALAIASPAWENDGSMERVVTNPLLAVSLAFAMLAVGCKSSGTTARNVRQYDWAALDARLPSGATSTPSHRLPRYEYPFDARGNYISSWAAEGERRRGASAYASASSTPSYSRPSSTSKPKPKPQPSYRYHTVVAGDTLYSLSRRYGTTVSRIKSVNGLSSDLIVNGRRLRIP